jgi:hypothetical protein
MSEFVALDSAWVLVFQFVLDNGVKNSLECSRTRNMLRSNAIKHFDSSFVV